MDNDSTPGIWQTDTLVVVLAHVIYCVWQAQTPQREGLRSHVAPVWVAVAKDKAQRLAVRFSDKERSINLDIPSAESFVRALNLYWETRTTAPAPVP